MDFRRVLVGLKLETDAKSADAVPPATQRLFERAVEIAVAQRGELKLVAVVDGLDLCQVPASPQQIGLFSQILSERLDALTEQACESGVDCESLLVGGHAWSELLQQAEDFHAGLLLVGGGSATSRLSSTALKLLRFARCSVLVERFRSPPPLDAVPDNVGKNSDDAEGEPPHVLIADDLCDAFQQTLVSFVGSALWRDAKCWLTHVVPNDRWPEAWQPGLSTEQLSQRRTELTEAVQRRLFEHLGPTDHRTMTYGILPEVVDGDPVTTLLSLIEERHIDLLVCGRGARTADAVNLFGQVAEGLLPYVPCSVLLPARQ